jgi:hypothetical protein
MGSCYIAQASLQIAMEPKSGLELQVEILLSLLAPGITTVCHHAQLKRF